MNNLLPNPKSSQIPCGFHLIKSSINVFLCSGTKGSGSFSRQFSSKGETPAEVVILSLNCTERRASAVRLLFLFVVSKSCWDPSPGRQAERCGETLAAPASAELGDLEVPVYLYGVDGRQRLNAVVKIKQLVSVHKHPETWVLAENFHPERLVRDERKVRDR